MTNTRIGKSVRKSDQQGRAGLVMEQHKREVASHDLEKPAGKWERKLFIVSEIEGAASTETTASAVIQDSSASPTGLSREREVEERVKRFQEREQRKRVILGVHYLDEDGRVRVCVCVCRGDGRYIYDEGRYIYDDRIGVRLRLTQRMHSISATQCQTTCQF